MEKELSGDEWKLWLDREAEWINDDIYMPPVDISSIPVKPPTCGWDKLSSVADKIIGIPATVEEHFWSYNGNPWGEAGDYRGVSWWSTTFKADSNLKGKRITIKFESVVLRTEVFVNRKLIGYDIIGNTPFEVDVTNEVIFGGENTLDVRVTDPAGNFSWSNNDMYRWGKNRVPAYHGFGGITGKVYLRATDGVRVDDIYVQNKPKITEVEVFVTLKNLTDTMQKGKLSVVIHEWRNPSKMIWEKTLPVSIPLEGKEFPIYVKTPKAEIWNIKDPHLYIAQVKFTGNDGNIIDSMDRRFGFRWFDIGEKDGDERFYLNGKRIFVFGPMQRGYWPKNGMFPTPEMAKRNVELLIEMGFNTFIMNQCMVQPVATDICDEYGILTHSDPGGYRCNDRPDEKAAIWRREKLRRMIIRDRSKPSWFITLLKEETGIEPSDDDINNMKMAHSLDPTRLIVYNSDRNRKKDVIDTYGEDPFKLHMRPFDENLHYYGWWNHHHFIPTAGWIDDYYKNPRFYIRGQVARGDSSHLYDKGELIWLGEEGAFGSMIRLQKIKEELDRTGAAGWREMLHIDYFNAYDRFLDESGFRIAFPSVDELTLALGKNMHYYHGRNLENARISNLVDAYNLNGWASASTHTDLTDQYRNPTGDPSIIAYYSQPLYVAVKIRTTVIPAGASSIADFFIINEVNLKGNKTLEVELIDPSGQKVFSKIYNVKVRGGEDFGQLLIENMQLPVMNNPGYYKVNATIKTKEKIEANGSDSIFVVDYLTSSGLKGKGAVIDTSGVIKAFLKESRGITLPDYDPSSTDLDYIIIGRHDTGSSGRRRNSEIMDMVASGTTLIILDQTDIWAQRMDNQALRYINSLNWGNNGRLFVGKSHFLKGLPQAQSMNWEYQVFYSRRPSAINIDFLGTELIVGLASQERKEIGSALIRIPFGNGQIFLSTLNILSELSPDKPQSVVAKKLFLNLLDFFE
ncbi:glycoside hydrolase family 2 protein [Candidatus Latescibacterota bacterium]